MSERLWQLKRCNLFEQLSEDELRELERRSRARTFARNSPIYLPADSTDAVFLLTTGRAKICHITPEGKQSILSFIEPGEIFGELALLDPGSEREEYAEAILKTTLVLIPGDVIRTTMQKQPNLTLGITKLIGLRRKRIEQRLKNLLFLSNRERLSHLLLELVEQYGQPVSDGIDLGIKLSHQELANVIGSTRETVTVVLGELSGEGLIRVGRRKIVLLDVNRLAESVQREAPVKPPPQTQTPTPTYDSP